MSTSRQQYLYFIAILYTISVYGTMAMMSIGAGILAAGWLTLRWGSLQDDLASARQSKIFWPTAFLGLACLWSLVWAKFSGLTFFEQRPTVTWDDTRKVWHLVFPFLLYAVFSTIPIGRIRRIIRVWLYCGVASAILGVVQHYIPIYPSMELPHIWDKEYSQVTGLLAHLRGHYHAAGLSGFHLSFTAILAFPSTMCFALMAVLVRREGLKRRTCIAIGASGLFFLTTLFTYSKIAWVALPLAMLAIGVIGFKGRTRYAVIGVILAATVVWASSSEVRGRFGGSGRTVKDRIEVWSANIEMIKQFPVFGVGWHRNSELSAAYYHIKNYIGFESHAHNNILDQWASTGLFGLTGFLWLNGMLILLAFRLYNENQDLLLRSLGLGLVAGWLCLHVNGLTQSNWWDAKVLHQIGWVTAITLDGIRRLEKKTV